MLRKKKYLFGGLVICIALGILIFAGLNSCSVYYYTVSELIEQGKYGEHVRVSGTIEGSSVKWDPTKPELDFTITDESASMPVVYKGDIPHTFEGNKNVVAEGEYDSDGIFRATKLVMKCASKYEAGN